MNNWINKRPLRPKLQRWIQTSNLHQSSTPAFYFCCSRVSVERSFYCITRVKMTHVSRNRRGRPRSAETFRDCTSSGRHRGEPNTQSVRVLMNGAEFTGTLADILPRKSLMWGEKWPLLHVLFLTVLWKVPDLFCDWSDKKGSWRRVDF